ncbi:hypothetical protein CEXT_617841 [Caerostris extrusa]|uniref:Uncharacterized protein n=1 Tax=Caerostris extrusa TaxID=172846 RepID=A0AAV4PLJ9_CAEEX|nr:hypothetical protein CEXT_617841 [Caerostris extrusa]
MVDVTLWRSVLFKNTKSIVKHGGGGSSTNTSAVRQPSAWSPIHLCENRASMTNANEGPHLNICKCRATNCRFNNLVWRSALVCEP